MTAAPRGSARDVIDALGLRPHPEGGWYAETWRAPDPADGSRSTGSAILYLLAAGERSHWHRIDADEVWQFAAGDPLELRIHPGEGDRRDGDAADAGPGDPARGTTIVRLGGDVLAGDVPQAVVPAGVWQAARPLGAWTLVGCIVAPAFDFGGFELASPDWDPTA